MDSSGARPSTVNVPSGEVFLGDSADPLVASYLPKGLISLIGADIPGVINGTLFGWNAGNQKTSFSVGSYGSELAFQLYDAYVNFWEWC